MKHRLYIILSLLSVAIATKAEDVSFRASAPAQVVVGTPFQLTYTVNQRAKDLRAPEFDNFDILAGPYTSQSSSTQYVNGKRTSTFTMTYTYTLRAQKEGTFNIQPASITVSHDTYNSNGLRITVLPADEQPSASQQSSGSAATSGQASSAQGNSKDMFMRTIVSKTNVYEQEAITLSYKLYFLVDVTQVTNNTKLPEFTGFVKQEMDLGNIQTSLEHYDGRNYQTATLYQTVLYPQRSGDIKIEPASFETIVRVRNKSQVHSIFDDFFDTYSNVNRQVTAPGITIHVKALPTGRPQGYSTGVGQFNMTSSITKNEAETNEAITLKIDISGAGNMKMLKNPIIDFPEAFEVYDPKVSNNFKSTTQGQTGTKSIEYLIIPRASGNYTIPPITYSYFDPQTAQYKTLTTPEYNLHIRKGANDAATATPQGSNFTSKEDIKQLGTDIRHIYTGELKSSKTELVRFGSGAFYLMYIVPLLLTIIISIVLRKRIRENADQQKVKYRKANKTAQKRLRKAKQLLSSADDRLFYEEIERTLWNYLSDRLVIPTAELSKNNIAELLRSHNVSEELIEKVNDCLTTAEAARYAPSLVGATKESIYSQTADIIGQLEDNIPAL